MTRHAVSRRGGLAAILSAALLVASAPAAADCIDYGNYARRVATLTPPDQPMRGTVVGDLAYVAANNGLWILDISDPAAPTTVSHTILPVFGDLAWDVAVTGGHAYVVGLSQTEVVDVSNPAAPSVVGSSSVLGMRVTANGSHIYVGGQVLDVSDPTNPVPVASTPGEVFGIVGTVAYATQSSTLNVVDLSDPESPQPLGSVAIPDLGMAAAVAGNRVYLTDSDSIRVVDVSNPAAPTVIGSLGGSAWDLDAQGTVVCATGDQLRVIDASDPSNPVVTYSHPLDGGIATVTLAWPLCLAGSWTCVGDCYSWFDIFDLTHLGAAPQLGAISSGRQVVVSGSLAYLAGGGLKVVDIADPTSPSLLGSVAAPGYDWDLALTGSHVAVAAGTSGLQMFDVSNPAAPFLAGSAPTANEAFAVAGAGSHVYVADISAVLQVFDVSDPTLPVQVGSTPAPACNGMVLSGTRLYMAGLGAGLAIVDVSDPTAPTVIGGIDPPGQPHGVAVAEGLAYLTTYAEGLQIVNVADPATPVLLGSIEILGSPENVVTMNGTAYVAAGEGGLVVVNVSNPNAPVLIGANDKVQATDVAKDGDLVAVAGGPLVLLPRQCPETTGIRPPDAPSAAARLFQSRPNPFTGSASPAVIPFSLARSGQVTLRVFDISGRRVRSLVDGFLKGGEYQMPWDGRDDHGREAAAGIYLYRLETPGLVATRRLVRLP